MLRLLKRIERRAGRRLGRRWGPRPLDIDILDYRGTRIGWPPRRREPGRLILPHPEMHRRVFVLVPLLEIAPHWRHPILGLGARALLSHLAPAKVADMRQEP
jgi:2-amino-4-hydroxy-6-hydroxymethyldihydropteridine diphosphokinase